MGHHRGRRGLCVHCGSQESRVQKCTSDGACVTQIGGPGTKRGSLSYPTDVTVDSEGDVYICTWNKNAWDRGRTRSLMLRAVSSRVWSATPSTLHVGQMTVAANTDYLKRRREVPSTEPEWTFAEPTAVVFDAVHNRILVADTQRSRIQIYNKLSNYLVPQMNL